MNPKINEINPDTFYSASYVVKSKWFLWSAVLSFTTFLNTSEGNRIFKPIIITKGAVKRYRIKGSDIIEALKLHEKGELKIDYE